VAPAAISDADLVARLRRGDPAAFDEAYATHQPRLYAFVLRLLQRRDLADDLTQETWIRLATHGRGLRPDTQLGAWLFTVARNLTLSFRRWARLDLASLLQLRAPANPVPSPLELTAASQIERRLEAALAALPDKYREVLLLIAVEGLAHDAAAAVVGLRPDAFRQRLSRARAMMEDRLSEEKSAEGQLVT
jgi:RNA polymerase sigma-70 factor (ECF subfamily)